MTVSLQDMVKNLTESGLLSTRELDNFMESLPPEEKPINALMMAEVLTRHGKLTQYQATACYEGNIRGLVLGDYVIVSQLGKGGMGQVFRAKHRRMNRMVALKILAPASAISETAIRRFHREVELAAKLSHPHIVTAYDANEHHGVHYLVMELVDGDNLSAMVKREGPFPIEKALDCILQASRGLAYAHQQGIVHRDIKPSNLLMDKSGTVKILDLGLARLDIHDLALDEEGEGLTQTNQVLGTVDFMAPEQSLNAREADHRADIYSLGCTLYRLLTGKNVYVGGTVVEKIVAHREHPIPSVLELRPDAPPELEQLLQRMLAKKPADRIGTMTDVIREIEGILGIPSQADPTRDPRASGTLPKLSEIAHDAETPSESRTGWDHESPHEALSQVRKIEIPRKPGSQSKAESSKAEPSRAETAKAEPSKSETQREPSSEPPEPKSETEAQEEPAPEPEPPKPTAKPVELKRPTTEDSDSRTLSPSATLSSRMSRADLVRPDDTVATALKEMKTRPWLVALLLALIGLTSLPMVLVFVLPSPRLRPETVVANAALDGFGLLDAPPLTTAAVDAQLALAVTGLPNPVNTTEVVATESGFASLLTKALPAAAPQDKALQLSVLWVSAHGVSRAGAAELLCRDFQPGKDGGQYPFSKLLEEFRASAGAKLLLLDAGSIVQDPRLGMMVNEFPRLAMESVQATNDPQLWVLLSHGQLEYSHVAPAWRQTVFAHFTAQGLSGAADLNADGKVDLAELARYLSGAVGAHVKQATSGRESQTPTLVWGGGAQPPEGTTLSDLAGQTVVTLIYKGSRARTPQPFVQTAPRTRLASAVEEGWRLRDGLDSRRATYQLSFIDFAPHLWHEYQDTLLAAERLTWPDSNVSDERALALAADLERTNARLADILADRKPAATLTNDELGARLTASQPEVIAGLNDVRSFALFDRLAWAPGAAVIGEIKSLEQEFDDRLGGNERELYAWATGPANKYNPLVELRLTSKIARRAARIPIDLAKSALVARRDAERAAAWATHYGVQPGGEGWAPFWLRERMEQADLLLAAAERSLGYESVEMAELHADPLREAQRLYTSVLEDVNRVRNALRVRNELLFYMPYYLAWESHAGAQATDEQRAQMLAPGGTDLRRLIGRLKVMTQLQLSPPTNLPVQLEAEAHAASDLIKKLNEAFSNQRLTELEGSSAKPGVSSQIRTLLSTPLAPAEARKRLLAALAKAVEEQSEPVEAPAEIPLPAAANVADWRALFGNLELRNEWVQLSASLTGKPHPLDQEWVAVSLAFQQYSKSATPELEAALWKACRAYGAARAAWQAGLPAQLLAQQKSALEAEDAKGPAARFAALESIQLQTAWIDSRDARAAQGLEAAELLRRVQLQCLFYWHEQRFLEDIEGARQADQAYFREAARVYRRQGDLLKSGK